MKQDANAPNPIPLGSEGRDGAFDFARRQDFEEISHGSSTAMGDILSELPHQFSVAIEAQAAFSKWLSSRDHSMAEIARRLRDVLVAGQPYVCAYDAFEMNFPEHLGLIHDRLTPVKDEVLPGEGIEGEGTPGLTIAGGAGHA